jgi:hypothetical protein
MDAEGAELADRIRALVGAELALEEKRMFGTRAFLVDGKILAASRGGGVLLIRVGEENGAVLVGRPGASCAQMGAKTMGNSWLDVQPHVIADDADLMFWLDAARENLGID